MFGVNFVLDKKFFNIGFGCKGFLSGIDPDYDDYNFLVNFIVGNIPKDKVSQELIVTTGLAAGRVGYDGTEAGINEALIEDVGALFYGAYEQLFVKTNDLTDESSWLFSSITTIQSLVACPYGGLSFELIESVTNALHSIVQFYPTIGTKYTVSCCARNTSDRYMAFRGAGVGSACPVFDVINGVIINDGNQWENTQIHYIENGWYLCISSCVAAAVTPFRVQLVDDPAVLTAYVGDGVSRLLICRPQCTEGTLNYPYVENSTASQIVVPENNSSTDRGSKADYSDMPQLLDALYGTDGTDAEGKLSLTWRPMYNASEVTGTVNILTTDDGATNTLHYDADNNLLKLTDGTNTSSIACTPVADTEYSIVGNWDEVGGLQISLDSVDGSLTSFAGRFPTEDEMSFAWEADAPQYVKLSSIEKESDF